MDYRKGVVTIGPRTVVARTCTMCGEFLSGKHFASGFKTVKGTRYKITEAVCGTCNSRRGRAKNGNVVGLRYNRKNYDKTVDTATMNREPWTLTALDRIVSLRNEGLTIQQIAVEVGRTYYSLSYAVSHFGLTKDWPEREKWAIRFAEVSSSASV